MIELTTTRHNLLIDPFLHVWSWEIPLYLFLGGIVAGLMVLGGIAQVRLAKGQDPRHFFSMQAPILAFILLNIGMGALFLDLAHKLYVWAIYVTLQPTAPMSWGAWVLLIVFPLLLASALIRLPEAWPWIADQFPVLRQWSARLEATPKWIAALGWLNIVFGAILGIYTGILLSTMVARPLWNQSLLGPLFLVSGLSASSALMHLISIVAPPYRPAPRGPIRGLLNALTQPVGHEASFRNSADIAFLTIELLLLGLLLIGLMTGSASHHAALGLLMQGKFAVAFWGILVGMGIVLPLVIQGFELRHRFPRTVIPAVLALIGGYTLRWLMVNAGQVSSIVQSAN